MDTLDLQLLTLYSGGVVTISSVFAVFLIDTYFFSTFIVGLSMIVLPLIISNIFQNKDTITIRNPITKNIKSDVR